MGLLIYATDPHIIHLKFLAQRSLDGQRDMRHGFSLVFVPHLKSHDFPSVFTGRKMEGS